MRVYYEKLTQEQKTILGQLVSDASPVFKNAVACEVYDSEINDTTMAMVSVDIVDEEMITVYIDFTRKITEYGRLKVNL